MRSDFVRTTPLKPQLHENIRLYNIVDFFFLALTVVFLSQIGGAVITAASHTGSLYTSKSNYLPQQLLGEVRDNFTVPYYL